MVGTASWPLWNMPGWLLAEASDDFEHGGVHCAVVRWWRSGGERLAVRSLFWFEPRQRPPMRLRAWRSDKQEAGPYECATGGTGMQVASGMCREMLERSLIWRWCSLWPGLRQRAKRRRRVRLPNPRAVSVADDALDAKDAGLMSRGDSSGAACELSRLARLVLS
jgi:hypothetical protein